MLERIDRISGVVKVKSLRLSCQLTVIMKDTELYMKEMRLAAETVSEMSFSKYSLLELLELNKYLSERNDSLSKMKLIAIRNEIDNR